MTLIQSAIKFISTSRLKQPLPAIIRQYCSKNANSNGNNKNIEQSNSQLQTDPEEEKQNVNASSDNHFKDGLTITAYSMSGFRLNKNIQTIGPIIVFPRAVFSWNVESVDRINADSLLLFSLIRPRIETLIIGTGKNETASQIMKTILELSHKHKINVEILSTELACTHFNYMNAEGRMIAAALIPPSRIDHREDDIFNTQSFDNKLFTIDTMHTQDLQEFKK